ncbi:MAG: hypothetical protein JNK87_05585 [Bryobacterales bacterium]|nr:hypothetical protein [Bryobacterales bacterium]
MPAPGYPEGIAIRGKHVYVAGPTAFGITALAVIWRYNLESGAFTGQFPITFSNPNASMRGLSCITFGPDGKLYAIEPFVGVIRLNLDAANTQQIYSAFPPPPPTGALPNDLAFDNDGRL